MNNIEKYNDAFIKTFGISADELNGLKYQSIPVWDSVGHMSLVASIEDSFGIMLDADDIIDLSSYEKGMEILSKNYGIEF